MFRAELSTMIASSSRPLLTSHLPEANRISTRDLVLLTRDSVDAPGRERHKQDTETEDDRGDELEGKGKTPSGLALVFTSSADVVGAVIDPERNHDTECNGQLLQRHETTTDFGRCELSAIKHTEMSEGYLMIYANAYL